MKKWAILTINLILCFLSMNVFASQSTSAVEQLSQLLKGYQTYQANFKQVTYTTSTRRVGQRSEGKLMMMRPGKFRWETENPNRQIIIANGKTLWVYDLDLQQATKQTIDNKNNANPASLLTGNVSALLKQFVITHLPGAENRFKLVSRDSKSSFQSVEMKFSNKKLTEITVVNNLGETSHFSFSNIRLNEKLSPHLFEFKPPAGVDVLTQ